MKTVLVHGTFDLLHYGHLLLFRCARNLGDRLIVTLTGDAYVRKGEGRPVFNERQRLECIRECRSVDEAYIIPAVTGVDAILKYRPRIYAKGSDTDRTARALAQEQYAIASIGGEFKFIDTGTIFHSSELLSGRYLAAREDQKS